MSDMEITIRLPEALIARAHAVGMDIEQRSESFITLVESEIKRREAARGLLEIADQLTALPDEMKPTEDEISEARRAYWATRS